MKVFPARPGSHEKTGVKEGWYQGTNFTVDKNPSILRSSSFLLATNLIATLGSGLTSILVARSAGPDQFGAVILFLSTTLTLALFSDFAGISYSTSYNIARSQIPKNKLSELKSTVVAYGMAAALTFSLVFVNTPLQKLVFPTLDTQLAGLIVVATLFQAIQNQLRGIFMGSCSFVTAGLMPVVQIFLYSAPVWILCTFKSSVNGREISVCYTASVILTAVMFAVITFKNGIALPSTMLLKQLSNVGFRAALVNILSFLQTRIDQYSVNYHLGTSSVGIYAVAVSVGEIITRLPSAFALVIFPTVAAEKNQLAIAKKTIRHAVLATLVGLAGVLLLVPFIRPGILWLYGEDYVGVERSLALRTPGIVLLGAVILMNSHLAGLGYPTIKIVAMLSAMGINFGLCWLLLPSIGLVGAAVAVTASNAIWFITLLAYFKVKLLRTKHQPSENESVPKAASR